tara:strand:- start:179 stop:814 length:636 start_codon:yes stop_codon:yes gene_type:complete
MYEYIKNNKKCINDKIKFINIESIKKIITIFLTNFDFTQLQEQVFKIYNFMRFNKNINNEIIEYMFIFATLRYVNDMVDLIYTIINDKYFYKNLKDIFESLSDISKCISITGVDMNKNDIDTIIKFYNYDINKVKKIYKLSTYNLMVAMCMVYNKPPTTIFKIKLGIKNNKYIKGRNTIKNEFKNKYPDANLTTLENEDRIGVMYFALNHL